MSIIKRLLISLGWIGLAAAGYWLMRALRLVGTEWINTPGALRVLGLFGLSMIIVVAPVVLAILALVARPTGWYRKFQ